MILWSITLQTYTHLHFSYFSKETILWVLIASILLGHFYRVQGTEKYSWRNKIHIFSCVNPVSPADQDRYFCKQCKWLAMSCLIRIYTACHSVFALWLAPLFEIMDATNLNDERVHFINLERVIENNLVTCGKTYSSSISWGKMLVVNCEMRIWHKHTASSTAVSPSNSS